MISDRDFFARLLTSGGELCHLTDVGGLGSLTAGVGINFGIEDEDVDVFAGCQYVVYAAEADVVCPAVAAEDPAGLLVQIILLGQDVCCQAASLTVTVILTGSLQLLHMSQIAFGVGTQSLLAFVSAQECDGFIDAHDAGFQSGDIILGGSLVCVAVIEGVQPLLCCFLQFGTSVRNFQQSAGGVFQSVTDGLLAIVQTQAVFCAVFEQGVGPSGTLAFLVDGVGRGSSGAAPDGGAAGGVGDDHVIAEQLRDQTAHRWFRRSLRRSRRTPAGARVNWLPLTVWSTNSSLTETLSTQ